METKYRSYGRGELYDILERTREIAGEPHKLYAGFVMCALYDQVVVEDDEIDESLGVFRNLFEHERLIGKDDVRAIVKECAEDFAAAIRDNGTIEINDKPYSIRRPNTVNIKKLTDICNFPEKDGKYLIVPEGILDLEFSHEDSIGKSLTEKSQDNINFFKKLVLVAESDGGDGIDKLTDMEATAYYYCKDLLKVDRDTPINDDYLHEWYRKNKEYCGTKLKDIMDCWTLKTRTMAPHIGCSTYCFSADAIRKWNEDHGQESVVDDQDKQEAADYWFETASNKSFRIRY